jgi:hypothetical protein
VKVLPLTVVLAFTLVQTAPALTVFAWTAFVGAAIGAANEKSTTAAVATEINLVVD